MANNVISLNMPPKVVAAAIKARSTSIRPDIETALSAERKRVSELLTVAEQSLKFGVELNLRAVIDQGASVDEVRAHVMEVAVSERETDA